MENTENTLTIEPYSNEPRSSTQLPAHDISSSEGEGEEEEEREELDTNIDRIDNTDWCICENCVPMPTGRESVCCKEMEKVVEVMEEAEVDCMAEHEGFQGACLNRYVVEMSMYAYVTDVSPLDDNEMPQKTYRYIAYRNFSRLVYHRLRKFERKIIPSCCVNKIRESYPSQQYCGFKYARP